MRPARSAAISGYEEETRIKAGHARLLLTAVCALGLTLLIWAVAAALGVDLSDVALGRIKDFIKYDESAVLPAGRVAAIKLLAPAIVFGLACLPAWFSVKGWSDHVARTAWSSFRADLFGVVEAQRSVINDGLAPDLYRPASSNAAQVWEALRGFISRGAGDRPRLWPPNGAEIPFAWTVVTGQPGAGKTRLVTEVARHFRRLHRFDQRRPWRRRLLAAWAWLSEETPWLMRHPSHPWDAGLLKPAALRTSDLEAWLPRRPTVLILDDCGPGEAAGVIKLLADRAPAFRKPVRLVFVNQVLPSDLQLRWKGGRPVDSNLPDFQPLDIAVEPHAEWSRDPGALRGFIEHLKDHYEGLGYYARAHLANIWRELCLDAHFTALARVVKGNPLLVELAVDELARGRKLGDLNNQRDILARRAQLVRANLDRAGLSEPDAVRALAVATLADGPDWTRWSRVLDDKRPNQAKMLEAFPHAPEASELSAWIEAHERAVLDLPAAHVPAIRPDLIGDVLLDVWIQEVGDAHRRETAAAWVALAWGCSAATQRAAQRRAANETGSPTQALLTEALQARPDPAWFPDSISYAVAMVDNALQFSGSLDFAVDAISRIEPERLEDFSPSLLAALRAPGVDPARAMVVAVRFAEHAQSGRPLEFDALLDLSLAVFGHE